jgi:hypothetical protein
MAYSDIQEKLGQQMMANSVLLAEKYSQGNLFPKGSEGNPYSKNPRAQSAKRKRDYKKAQEEKRKNQERLKDLPSDADIQTKGNMQGQLTPEEVFGEDYEGGPTYLNSENLNRLLQIGGAVGGGLLRHLLINPMNLQMSNLPYTPPIERIVLPNGRMIDSPLRFKTDQERIRFMDDWVKGETKYS